MMGSRRREVTKWFGSQCKYTVMYNSHNDRFCIRDIKNHVAVGEFMTFDDATEYCFDLAFDTLEGVG
jgi:hypothetical protein